MSINCQADPCPVLVNASCVFYEGPNLICLGVNTNETLESALEKINSLFCQVLSQQGSSGTSGTSGSSGSSGTSGTNGSNGTSGSNGRNGSSGSSGSAGSSGTSGEKGDVYRTFSTTCFTLGDAGTIFVEPGLAYTPAQSIVIAYDAFNYQVCEVISYNSITGELVFSLPATVVGAIDEYCTWDVNLNGASGGDGSDGTSGTNGSDGSNGTSGISCLSANITNNSGDTFLNVEYFECNGDYQNYSISPFGSVPICYQSGTLDIIGDYILEPLGICSGTSGSSGLTCTSIEVTNITLDPKEFSYFDCYNNTISVEIPAEQFISVCATIWGENESFNIATNGVCNGTSGTSGTNGTGGGGSSCPDHFKLAAVSGIFASNNVNSPGLKDMFSGNQGLGWSYGSYDAKPQIDGFGNLITLKYDFVNCGIPLSVDLNVGDTIRISGIAYIVFGATDPVNPIFYVTVSRFNCSDVSQKASNTPLSTVIPVKSYPIPLETGKVCFSEFINLAEILPSNETFFVVGITIGNDDFRVLANIRFSYTLDVTQACIGTEGKNLLISNCCDPAYTNIIINNLVPIGESFVDTDGNCWTVVAETLNAVTAVRTKSTAYADCDACIDANPCPLNFTIKSCCADDPQVFSAALIGVDVGDTFVDTNGFCWSAEGTTPLPITNVVEVGTVYPITDCESNVCRDLNECPTPVLLTSCCKTLGGYTTLELLQATLPTLVLGDVFVDTFGMCWEIRASDYAFPDLSFIVPVTEYAPGVETSACEECTTANICPPDYYYTVQNCCTEEIEVVVLQAVYNIGESLLLWLDVAFGCYKVLSWSDTGTITATLVNVDGVSLTCNDCLKLMLERYGDIYCQETRQCCNRYKNISGSTANITGYTCDGTWLDRYVMASGELLCMAIVIRLDKEFIIEQGCCEFDVYNPSATESITIDYDVCPVSGSKQTIVIPPLTTFTEEYFARTGGEKCLSCLNKSNGPWEYLPCPF